MDTLEENLKSKNTRGKLAPRGEPAGPNDRLRKLVVGTYHVYFLLLKVIILNIFNKD